MNIELVEQLLHIAVEEFVEKLCYLLKAEEINLTHQLLTQPLSTTNTGKQTK